MRQDRNQTDYGIDGTDGGFLEIHAGLMDAIVEVLERPEHHGRLAVDLRKTLRRSHFRSIRSGDLKLGARRLYKIAAALGIEVQVQFKVPDSTAA